MTRAPSIHAFSRDPKRSATRGARSRARRPAFTLVEVLATLVLIGIVIPVAMQGVSVAMSAASNARRTAEAAALGEAQLNKLVASRDFQFGVVSGDFAPQWPDYKWNVETLQRDFGVTEIILHVSWLDRGRERSLAVSTFAAPLDDAANPFGSGVIP
jgi:prepilin-type N-terminal cleavage/methylation domain-containing protein